MGVKKCPEESIPHAAQALRPSSGLVSGRIESPTPRKITAIIKMGKNPECRLESDNLFTSWCPVSRAVCAWSLLPIAILLVALPMDEYF